MGIPYNTLKDFAKQKDPLQAVVAYWLAENIEESVTPLSWGSIVAAVKSKHIDEPALAEQIRGRYCPQNAEIKFQEGQSFHHSRSMLLLYIGQK